LSVSLMTPKAAEPKTLLGIPKFGWFRMLNNSARHCRGRALPGLEFLES
jgi:hypothetical protein